MIAGAFTAGILHDTGKLVLASAMPELYAQAVRLAADELMPQWQAEANVFGVSHAEVGGYLAFAFGARHGIYGTGWFGDRCYRRND